MASNEQRLLSLIRAARTLDLEREVDNLATGGLGDFRVPEQRRGAQPDERSLVFALASVFIAQLSGDDPSKGIAPISRLDRIPRAARSPLLNALSNSPNDRPQRVAALLDELEGSVDVATHHRYDAALRAPSGSEDELWVGSKQESELFWNEHSAEPQEWYSVEITMG
jgi:hypothetical protein